MQAEVLMEITRVTDDSTGIYDLGDLDYGVKSYVMDKFLSNPDNRIKLTAWLRKIADMVQSETYPFDNRALKNRVVKAIK